MDHEWILVLFSWWQVTGENSSTTWTGTRSQQFNIWRSEALLSNIFRITPSVFNKHCNLSSATSLSAVLICPYSLKVGWKGVTVISAAIILPSRCYSCFIVRAPSLSILFASNITFPMAIKARNCLKFLFLSLHFVSTLYPWHLLFRSFGFDLLFQALFGLCKTQSAAPTCKQLSFWHGYSY